MIDAPAALRPLESPAEPSDRRFPRRAVLLAGCLLLALLPFVTVPGDVIADSKLDLPVNPVGFLDRALSLWDPQQFGQLQNQANGYLFPIGPFFALGRLAAVPPWILQRLWISAVLIAAFLGTVLLAERLRIGNPWTRVLGGLAYALSPMALTLLGEYSGEYLPQAMLPWILLPLASATSGHRGRAAARSAVAVAATSGVNAACTVAVLIPAVIFILTRPARWRLMAWWAPAVLLATVWWWIPLLLFAKYGVSFLPYTESAVTTTSVTSLDHALRGTENWISYLVVDGQPWWVVGYRISNQVLPALLSGLVAGLGLFGLVRRQMPERRFLLWSLLTGVVIVSSGYVSSLGNPLSAQVVDLINGPASAFRNLWKFDPLIHLPIALGLAQLLATVPRPRAPRVQKPGAQSPGALRRGALRRGALRITVIAAAVVGVGGLALPAYLSGLATAGSFRQIPSYEVSAGHWLNAHAGHDNVLLVPGAQFGQYTWGSPLDEVLQPLTSVDWAERDLSSIGSAGTERLLDAVDQRLADGQGSAGLTQVIAQMGIKYVVVRNDIKRDILEGSWPARVNQAIAESPGLTEVASFGPLVGDGVPDDAATNFDPPYPAVEIFGVAGAVPAASVQPAADTVRLYGAPESLLTLADEGMLSGHPVLLDNDDAGLPASGSVLTDSLRRKLRDFGELRTSFSPTLTGTQPLSTFFATTDYLEPGWSQFDSVASYTGIKDVTASSSGADIGTIPALWASGLQPYAAVDGDLRTKWESGAWAGPVGQWIQLSFNSAVNPGVIHVAFVENASIGPPVSQVTVTTAAGTITDQVRNTPEPQPLLVPPGASGWLRITIAGLAWPPPVSAFGSEVAISDITVPGVHPSRAMVAPPVPAEAGNPSAVVLAKAQPDQPGCMLTSLRWVCAPPLSAPTEEQYGFDHSFTEPAPTGPVTLRGTAMLADPALAAKYAAPGRGQPTVTASSTYTDDLQDQPRSAFDGNPATSWIASAQDTQPRLTIRWRRARTIRQVTIKRPPGAAGLLQVLISGDRGQGGGAVIKGASAVVRFAPMRTASLTLAFTESMAPLEVSDVVIPRVPSLSVPAVPFRLSCGLGPLIELNGQRVPTRLTGTFAELLSGQPMTFTACSPVTLAAGANHVIEPSADAFSVQDVVLGGLASPPDVTAATAVVKSWTPTKRTLEVTAPTRSYLVTDENFNRGWQAVAAGRPLRAVRLDGWRQAWLLPAGTSGLVTLTYQPDRLYRAAIFGGLVLLALLMLVAVSPWPRRRPPPARPPSGRTGQAGLLVTCALIPFVGLWLGGYPGAVILPVATVLFMVWARGPRLGQPRLGQPRLGQQLPAPLLAGLVLLAAAVAAAGHHMLLAGHSGRLVTTLNNALPQVIGLIVIAWLIAALVTDGPLPERGDHAGRRLAGVGQAWGTLAEADPLWAICVTPEARHHGWDEAEFYATGATEVELVLSYAERLGLRARGARALDFGCGAGRLTRALATRFDLVTGVDIAPGMLELAQRDNPMAARCRFQLNTRPDLELFDDAEFDLVYTSVVLQHLSPDLIRTYLAEFARVLRPGGSLVFQLPTRPRWTPRGLVYRCLPPAALGLIQRRLLGYPAPMRMHGLSERRVRRLLARHGVDVLVADSTAYSPDWHELRYYARRRPE